MNAVARTVGVDLGTRDDWTAIVVLDELTPVEDQPCMYAVSWLQRRRGLPYTAIGDELAAMADWPALHGAPFVVDATGLGRPVVDHLRERVSNVHAVVLTGGEHTVDEHAFESHTPKQDVVAAVQLLLQADRLRIDSRLAHAAALRDELLDFGYTISDSGRTRLEASSGHDDLVLAAGLAAWHATRDEANGAAAWTEYVRRRATRAPQPATAAEPVCDVDAMAAARNAAFRAGPYRETRLHRPT